MGEYDERTVAEISTLISRLIWMVLLGAALWSIGSYLLATIAGIIFDPTVLTMIGVFFVPWLAVRLFAIATNKGAVNEDASPAAKRQDAIDRAAWVKRTGKPAPYWEYHDAIDRAEWEKRNGGPLYRGQWRKKP
jgi:hypothetical protein